MTTSLQFDGTVQLSDDIRIPPYFLNVPFFILKVSNEINNLKRKLREIIDKDYSSIIRKNITTLDKQDAIKRFSETCEQFC